jgi:hypothetical protein
VIGILAAGLSYSQVTAAEPHTLEDGGQDLGLSLSIEQLTACMEKMI